MPFSHLRTIDRQACLLLVFTATLFCCTAYFGVRSPDSEVVFRTAQSLVESGSFHVEYLESWPFFGISPGIDGGQYGVFGPLLSILLAPWLFFCQALMGAEFLAPVSPYAQLDGVEMMLYDTSLGQSNESHRIRSMASLFNIGLATATVLCFYRCVTRLFQSKGIGMIGALLLAFASPFWFYSGTLFSEVLTTLCVVNMLANLAVDKPRPYRAGAWLGAGILSHLSAVLFIPFAIAFVWRRSSFRKSLSFGAGPLLALSLLAVFNWIRFGHVLETGRTVLSVDIMEANGLMYGEFVFPIEGVFGLLVGAGKGLFVFAPVLFFALIGLLSFRKKYPELFLFIIGVVLFRLLFIASRSDWHGGFCLGPRYLIPLLPLLLLPVLSALRGAEAKGRRNITLVFVGVCVFQQAYFSIGNLFAYDASLLALMELGYIEPTSIHLDWSISPVFRLHENGLGAYLPKMIGMGYFMTVFLLTLPIVYMFYLGFKRLEDEESIA